MGTILFGKERIKMKNNRRKFIKTFAAGASSSLMIPTMTSASGSEQIASGLAFQDLNIDDNSEAYWDLVKSQFQFASGLHYFNNASLGPSPIPVQMATDEYRKMLDGFPSKYMWGDWKDEIEKTREEVAGLFSVSKEEIALIHNTTEGMNLVARSFELEAGDEVILADHEHPSGTIPWVYWQEEKGVKLVRPELPLMPKTVEEIVDAYRKAITPKTKIISMCHIVNTNGMILPVKQVSKMAHEYGILVAVDGAQSAGMFQFDLHDLGCDYYAASSHKWLFSPKGVGVFYAKEESQKHLKPLIVARGYKDKSIRRLEKYNTRNLPEVLGLGAAIDFHKSIGSEKIAKRSFELKEYFRSKVKDHPKIKLKTPEADELSCAIQVVEILDSEVNEVKASLFESHGIDCRPMTGFDLNALRLSFAIYITKKDIDRLVETLEEV